MEKVYGTSHGLRLLGSLAEKHQGVFTSEEALQEAKALPVSSAQAYNLLSQLSKLHIKRVRGGLYIIESPLMSNLHVHEFNIATHLFVPSAIGGVSALNHWGLIDQIPTAITVDTLKRVTLDKGRIGKINSESLFKFENTSYSVRQIYPKLMFGVKKVWVDNQNLVPIFDKERMVLELFLDDKGLGAGNIAEEILDKFKSELDFFKLEEYATRVGNVEVAMKIQHLSKEARKKLGQEISENVL